MTKEEFEELTEIRKELGKLSIRLSVIGNRDEVSEGLIKLLKEIIFKVEDAYGDLALFLIREEKNVTNGRNN